MTLRPAALALITAGSNPTKNVVVPYNPGTANRPSIHFAARMRRTKNGSYRVPIGFIRIAEGRDVYRLFRAIQNGEKPEPLS